MEVEVAAGASGRQGDGGAQGDLRAGPKAPERHEGWWSELSSAAWCR